MSGHFESRTLFVFYKVWLYNSVQLCAQKYSSSVQVVYSNTVYLYMNLLKQSSMSIVCVIVSSVYMSCLFLICSGVFLKECHDHKKGCGPFWCPEKRFVIFSFVVVNII